jgi:N-acetylglutamate synthase-like GNAT family acetyltransferase
METIMEDQNTEQTIIEETADYESLTRLFIENELEFSDEDETPTDLVKCWALRVAGELAGGCVLALRNGEYIIDGIAVEPARRGLRLGERLLDLAANEARGLGGECLYLVARAPGFFRKRGFLTIPREGAPNFFECFSCPQYNSSCFPEVMRLDLRDRNPPR